MHVISRFFFSLLTLWLLLGPSYAIIRRIDVPDNTYTERASHFPSVCQLSGFDNESKALNFLTTVRLGKRTFISAAVPRQDIGELPIVRCGSTIYHIDPASFTFAPASPNAESDFCLFRIKEEKVTNASRVEIYKGGIMDLWGRNITIVGYGRPGDNVRGETTSYELQKDLFLFQKIFSFFSSLDATNLKPETKKVAYQHLASYSHLFEPRAAQLIVTDVSKEENRRCLCQKDPKARDQLTPEYYEELYDEEGVLIPMVAHYPIDKFVIATLSAQYDRAAFANPTRSLFEHDTFSIDSSTPPFAGLPANGDIGGGYFDESGKLVALHLRKESDCSQKKLMGYEAHEHLYSMLGYDKELVEEILSSVYCRVSTYGLFLGNYATWIQHTLRELEKKKESKIKRPKGRK